jgi:hypothetical protein
MPFRLSVVVKLQKNRRMIRRALRRRRGCPIETHFRQIKRIDKHVDHANRVALVNEIIETFGQQRRLPTIRLFNEAPYQLPPQNHERILANKQRFHTARVINGHLSNREIQQERRPKAASNVRRNYRCLRHAVAINPRLHQGYSTRCHTPCNALHHYHGAAAHRSGMGIGLWMAPEAPWQDSRTASRRRS